jgi:hypothetical protein
VRNSETGITEEKIKGLLQARKGILEVHGWKTRKIDDQTYVVAYLYDVGPASNTGGWIFEVNLEAKIVRPVLGDAELEKKYSDWDLQKKN